VDTPYMNVSASDVAALVARVMVMRMIAAIT
jgi:hypothetical protein